MIVSAKLPLQLLISCEDVPTYCHEANSVTIYYTNDLLGHYMYSLHSVNPPLFWI